MPYDRVFTGADGILVLSREEGSPADEVLDFYEIEEVGRVKSVEIYVHQDIRSFYSLGTNLPIELRTGNIKFSGKVRRAYINGALMRLLLGRYALEGENPQAPIAAPTFDMIVTLKTPDVADMDFMSKLTVNGVIFDNWSFAIPEDDFCLEEATFQAKRLLIADVQPE
jgi:hypothetical protein